MTRDDTKVSWVIWDKLVNTSRGAWNGFFLDRFFILIFLRFRISVTLFFGYFLASDTSSGIPGLGSGWTSRFLLHPILARFHNCLRPVPPLLFLGFLWRQIYPRLPAGYPAGKVASGSWVGIPDSWPGLPVGSGFLVPTIYAGVLLCLLPVFFFHPHLHIKSNKSAYIKGICFRILCKVHIKSNSNAGHKTILQPKAEGWKCVQVGL